MVPHADGGVSSAEEERMCEKIIKVFFSFFSPLCRPTYSLAAGWANYRTPNRTFQQIKSLLFLSAFFLFSDKKKKHALTDAVQDERCHWARRRPLMGRDGCNHIIQGADTIYGPKPAQRSSKVTLDDWCLHTAAR